MAKKKEKGKIRDENGNVIGLCHRDGDMIVLTDKTGRERRVQSSMTVREATRIFLESTPYVA